MVPASAPGTENGAQGSAGRLLLRPLGDPVAERLPAAVRALLDPAGPVFKRALRAGDLVTTEGVSFVVRVVEPAGRPDPERTEVDFDLAPGLEKRSVAEVVFLFDASWSMRRADLPPTRLEAVKRAATTALANSADLLRRVALMEFGADAVMVSPLGRPESLDLGALDALAPRGPGNVETAVSTALAYLAREGDPQNVQTLFLATDGALPVAVAKELAARAHRLGVELHVLDAGSPDARPFETMASVTGGTYHDAHAGCTFRPALNALAQRFGVPLAWRDPARGGGEIEFEVVLRAMTEKETSDFPALPRRMRRK